MQISKLVHVDNIALSPQWNDVAIGEVRYFTLIFEALPKECKNFDLIEEDINGEYEGWFAFYAENIPRNNYDVYNIRFK